MAEKGAGVDGGSELSSWGKEGGEKMMTVLLVEDNLMFRQSFKEALLAYMPALQIAEAADGVQALRLVEEFSPQVIFMDLKLTGESGIELTRKISELAPQAKIIMLTNPVTRSRVRHRCSGSGSQPFPGKRLLEHGRDCGIDHR